MRAAQPQPWDYTGPYTSCAAYAILSQSRNDGRRSLRTDGNGSIDLCRVLVNSGPTRLGRYLCFLRILRLLKEAFSIGPRSHWLAATLFLPQVQIRVHFITRQSSYHGEIEKRTKDRKRA